MFSAWPFPEKVCRIVFRGASWQNTACGEFCRLQRPKLNAKSVTKIFAKVPIWELWKLWQMHEIGKRVGIRRKRRSTEWNIFTVEDWGRGKIEVGYRWEHASIRNSATQSVQDEQWMDSFIIHLEDCELLVHISVRSRWKWFTFIDSVSNQSKWISYSARALQSMGQR